ncbi:unnamed protein product, partial [Hapterophycus canaliculatus]
QLLAEETEELLAASLAAMRVDLDGNPAWDGAPPPSDDFLLMFLRSEVFSPSAAAERYRKFWKIKVSLCGEEKAALPIKLGDVEAGLKTEFIQLVPGSKDIEGRQVLMLNAGNFDKKVPRNIRVLAMWYVVLAALEDVETQRRGLCFVASHKTLTLRQQFEPKFQKMAMGSMQGALPVRIGSMNMCYPRPFFRMIWTVVSPFLHERVKQRIRIFSGTDEEVRNALRYIVEPENLPAPMGEKPLDFSGWLTERARNET